MAGHIASLSGPSVAATKSLLNEIEVGGFDADAWDSIRQELRQRAIGLAD